MDPPTREVATAVAQRDAINREISAIEAAEQDEAEAARAEEQRAAREQQLRAIASGLVRGAT